MYIEIASHFIKKISFYKILQVLCVISIYIFENPLKFVKVIAKIIKSVIININHTLPLTIF